MIKQFTGAKLAFLLSILVLCACSGRGTEEIESPFIRSARYDFSDITRVELTDSSTVVTIRSEYVPNSSLDCGDDWYIRSLERDFTAKDYVGLSPEGNISYDHMGIAEFSVIFEALPNKVKSFDMISGNKVFDFFGVDLTGKACESQDSRVEWEEDADGPLEFDESFAESTINIHLLNCYPGFDSKISVGVIWALGYTEEDVTVDEKGEATVRFFQMGTAAYQVCFPNTQTGVDGVINPGESVDVYIDMNVFGHNIMRHRDGYHDSGVRYLSTSDRHLYINDLIMSADGFWDIFKVRHEFDEYEYEQAKEYAFRAENAGLTSEDFKQIDDFNWIFLTKSLHYMQEKVIDYLSDVDFEYQTVEDWVGAKEWLEGIASSYKGKVVVIDIWNTWCSPCRYAMDAMEPMKTGILESDDIVWIYLADDSSPITDYAKLIGKYNGIHYRLTSDQHKDLYDYLDLDGIPYYILVDRNGSISKHPDFRNHDLMVRVLLDNVRVF